jgi:KTSC domain-containing protein
MVEGAHAHMPSTVIWFFTYDAPDQRLTVVFKSGRRYVYLGVPPNIVEEFRAAFSKGEYFNAHIRDHFAFERAGSATSG